MHQVPDVPLKSLGFRKQTIRHSDIIYMAAPVMDFRHACEP